MHASLNNYIAWTFAPVQDRHFSSSLTEPVCGGTSRFLKSSPEAVENPFSMSFSSTCSCTDLKFAVVSRLRYLVELVWDPSESPLTGPVRLIRSVGARSCVPCLVLDRLIESWLRAVWNTEVSGVTAKVVKPQNVL